MLTLKNLQPWIRLPSFMGSMKNLWRKSQLTNYLRSPASTGLLTLPGAPSMLPQTPSADDLASCFTWKTTSHHPTIHSSNKYLLSPSVSKGYFWVLGIQQWIQETKPCGAYIPVGSEWQQTNEQVLYCTVCPILKLSQRKIKRGQGRNKWTFLKDGKEDLHW